MSGLPTPDLIWQLNGQTIRPDSAHKMLVRENGVHSLVIEPVTSRDAGIYTCIATNRAGQNSFNLELIVAGTQKHTKSCLIFMSQKNDSVTHSSPQPKRCTRPRHSWRSCRTRVWLRVILCDWSVVSQGFPTHKSSGKGRMSHSPTIQTESGEHLWAVQLS